MVRGWAGGSAQSGAVKGPLGPAQGLVAIALAAKSVGKGWFPAPSCAGGRGDAGHQPFAV